MLIHVNNLSNKKKDLPASEGNPKVSPESEQTISQYIQRSKWRRPVFKGIAVPCVTSYTRKPGYYRQQKECNMLPLLLIEIYLLFSFVFVFRPATVGMLSLTSPLLWWITREAIETGLVKWMGGTMWVRICEFVREEVRRGKKGKKKSDRLPVYRVISSGAEVNTTHYH